MRIVALVPLCAASLGASAQVPQFLMPQVLDVGEQPNSLGIGDLDGDGVEDLVVVNSWVLDAVTVVLDPGGAATTTTFPAGPMVLEVAVGDLDGDLDLDLVVCQFGGDTLIFLNDGSGAFTLGPTFPSGAENIAVRVDDVDGDGDLDILLADMGSFGKLVVLLGNGNATFGAPVSFQTGGRQTTSLATGDVDNDGTLDVVLGSEGTHGQSLDGGASYSVLRGLGNGTFQSGVSTRVRSAGNRPESVALADVDADGNLDLLISTLGDDIPKLLILRGLGNGTFAPVERYLEGEFTTPGRLVLADLDGDGPLDVISGHGSGQLLVYWGRGDGTFEVPQLLSVGSSAQVVSVTDVDLDGTPDLAVADYDSNAVLLIRGLGGRKFGAATYHHGGYTGQGPSALATGDLDGDGLADIGLYTDDELEVLLSTGVPGDYATGPLQAFAGGGSGEALVFADLDGDAAIDAVATTLGGNLKVLGGVGDGTFLAHTNYPAGGAQSVLHDSAALADFDGDGDLDAALADSGLDAIQVLLGNGDLTFGAPTAFTAGILEPDAITTGDLDGDGDADVVAAGGASPAPTATVLLGNGNGTFGAPTTYLLGSTGSGADVQLVDLDLDGDLDVVAVVAVGETAVLEANGDGTFQPAATYAAGNSPLEGVVGEFDGDGVPDFAVLNSGLSDLPSVGIYLGNGDATFQPMVTLPVASGLRIAVDDLDGDGLDDIATLVNGFGGVQVLLQTP